MLLSLWQVEVGAPSTIAINSVPKTHTRLGPILLNYIKDRTRLY